MLVSVSLMAATALYAQTPAAPQGQSQSAKPASPADANPFPGEDTAAPVLPTTRTLASDAAAADDQPADASLYLPTTDTDPARSPDDAISSETSGGVDTLFSSSLTGVRDPNPSDADPGDEAHSRRARSRSAKDAAKDEPHQETVAEDLSVGSYYLSLRNWKGALSRFQSARILDPESPDAFFGLAEAERHLNDFADARAHYETVLEYDPDGPHGNACRKALKELPLSVPLTEKSSDAGTSAK